MRLLPVFLLSFASICYEIVLARLFSLNQGNVLAFFVIGIAMLGSAAGGLGYSAYLRGKYPAPAPADEGKPAPTESPGPRGSQAAASEGSAFPLGLSCLAAWLSLILAFFAAKFLPLDYLRFPVDGSQFLILLLDFLLLSLPFFFCGISTCAAYGEIPERSGALSLVSLAGSAAGALAPLILFPLLGEGRTLILVSSSLLLPAAQSEFPFLRKGRSRRRLFVSALALACAVLFASGSLLSLPLSPYKALSQLQKIPGTKVEKTIFDIRGRIDVVECPAFRFAPGLSIGYEGPLPRQTAVLIDGDGVLAIPGPGTDIDFIRWTLPALGYLLASPSAASSAGRCLAVVGNGASAYLRALVFGSGGSTVLVEHPAVAALLEARGRDILAGGEDIPECRAENPRAFLARAVGQYEVIEVENWGSSMPGMESLASGFLYTVDAFRAYWRALSPGGVLILPRRVLLPPQDILRLFAAAAQALREEGIARPEEMIAAARSWDASLLLVSRSPLAGARLERMKAFTKEMAFDLDWFPGIRAEEANRFNRYDRPYHYEAILSLLGNPGFAGEYPLDVLPQSDDRPFPSKFLKWLRLDEYFRSTGERAYILLLSGEVALIAILCAAVLSSLLLLLPLLVAKRGGRGIPARGALMFASCGAGFLFAEVAFLDAFGLLFPNPSLCFALVLSGMLAFSGLGGLLSGKLGRGGFRIVSLLLPPTAAASAFFLRPATAFALSLTPIAGIIFALGLMAFPSCLLGMPFPLAMRLGSSEPREKSASWAFNGCFSVLASILAAPIAMSIGIRALLLFSACAYCIMAVCALLPGFGGGRRFPIKTDRMGEG